MAKEWLEWIRDSRPASFPEQEKKDIEIFPPTLPAMRRLT
jgi:hypothetical protein